MEQKIKLIVKTSRDEMIKVRDNLVEEAGKDLISYSDDTVNTKDTLYMFKSVLIDRTPLVVIKSHNPHEIDIDAVITEYRKIIEFLVDIDTNINKVTKDKLTAVIEETEEAISKPAGDGDQDPSDDSISEEEAAKIREGVI